MMFLLKMKTACAHRWENRPIRSKTTTICIVIFFTKCVDKLFLFFIFIFFKKNILNQKIFLKYFFFVNFQIKIKIFNYSKFFLIKKICKMFCRFLCSRFEMAGRYEAPKWIFNVSAAVGHFEQWTELSIQKQIFFTTQSTNDI